MSDPNDEAKAAEQARRMDVAKLIQEGRSRLKMTPAQLAHATGLSRFTISRLEEGKQNLQLDQAQKLAAALYLPLARILAIIPGWRDSLLAIAGELDVLSRHLKVLAGEPDA